MVVFFALSSNLAAMSAETSSFEEVSSAVFEMTAAGLGFKYETAPLPFRHSNVVFNFWILVPPGDGEEDFNPSERLP